MLHLSIRRPFVFHYCDYKYQTMKRKDILPLYIETNYMIKYYARYVMLDVHILKPTWCISTENIKYYK